MRWVMVQLGQKRNTFVGTPFWMVGYWLLTRFIERSQAPEVIKQNDYDEKAPPLRRHCRFTAAG